MTAPRLAFAALACHLLLAGAAPAADGPPRTAEAILADYNAITFPTLDRENKDPAAVRAFREAYGAAKARQGELALELFRAHPDHDQVPRLLIARWPDRIMNPATAGAAVAEIDAAIGRFQDPEQAKEARFMRVVGVVRSRAGHAEDALPEVEAYLAANPGDRRAALMLSGYLSEVKDPALQVKLLRRIIAEFPSSPQAGAASARLALLENLGKPLDLEFTDAIGGKPVSIKGLRGKVVVLDFWATWCGPCVAEMPKMKKLYAEFKDKGVEFIGVSLDQPEDEGGLDKLKAFVRKNEIAWPQYYQGSGFESAFSTRMGINAIPQLFLVDADGNLASIDARDRLETLLPEYLARAAKGPKPATP